MIYVNKQASKEADHPPMAGTRIRHEIVDDDVMRVWIEHADQSFQGDRQADVMVVPLRERPHPGTAHWERCVEAAVNTTHVRPLVSPDDSRDGD